MSNTGIYSLVEVKGTSEQQDKAIEDYCKEHNKEVHSVDRVGKYSVYTLKEKLQ